MKEKVKKSYINTTIDPELLRELKILAAIEGVRMNKLLEQAIKDLLKKKAKKK